MAVVGLSSDNCRAADTRPDVIALCVSQSGGLAQLVAECRGAVAAVRVVLLFLGGIPEDAEEAGADAVANGDDGMAGLAAAIRSAVV